MPRAKATRRDHWPGVYDHVRAQRRRAARIFAEARGEEPPPPTDPETLVAQGSELPDDLAGEFGRSASVLVHPDDRVELACVVVWHPLGEGMAAYRLEVRPATSDEETWVVLEPDAARTMYPTETASAEEFIEEHRRAKAASPNDLVRRGDV